ncbi:MAG: dihydropteroate synthase [Leptonema sp. (in: bacteria)]
MNFGVKIAGILNITEDSFSDGGDFLKFENAIKKTHTLILEGADVIDVGAISSNPNGKDVPIELEIKRLKPIVGYALKNRIAISIDTWRLEVQKFFLEYPIHFLNDITGFSHPEIYPILRDHSCKLILMHQISSGRAEIIDHNEKIVERIFRFFDQRLEQFIQAGISEDRIIIDPGMGFFLGSDPMISFQVINAIPEIKKRYKLPVYISVSRKSFLGKVANIENPKERNYVTLACELELIKKGIDWIRTHDPKPIRDSLKILQWIQ